MTTTEHADRIFAALADETRRDILKRLSGKTCTVGELASHYRMTLPAVSKHVRTLEEAQLLSKEKVGRSQICRIEPNAMAVAMGQLDFYRNFWSGQLDRLDEYLQKDVETMTQSVNLTRVFNAPAETVFKAIEHGMLFRDTGIINESLKIDFRQGGTYTFEWVSGGRCSGSFTEISPFDRVVFTWETSETDAPTAGPTVVSIDLAEHDDGTRLTLNHSGIPTGTSYENHLHGWTTSLDDFTQTISSVETARTYEWGHQPLEVHISADVEEVFQTWATPAGLMSFLAESGSVTDGKGDTRSDGDAIETGDRYRFVLPNGASVYGKFLAVQPHTVVALTFGHVDLRVTFRGDAEATAVTITQNHIPDFEEAKVLYHVVQHDLLLRSLYRLKTTVESKR